MVVVVIFRFKYNLPRGQAFLSFHISVHFVIDTTFQFCTLSGEFLRVHGNILVTGGTGSHRNEAGHPAGAAKFASARSDTSDTPSFLAGSDLLHLDTYAECFGQDFDQLAEVDTFVCDVVENSLVAIPLVFYVTDLHVQPQVCCDLA